MRTALAFAGVGLALMGATFASPPIDASTRALATELGVLGMALFAGGACLAIRALVAPDVKEDSE